MNQEVRDDLKAVLKECMDALDGLLDTGGEFDPVAINKAMSALKKARRAYKVLGDF